MSPLPDLLPSVHRHPLSFLLHRTKPQSLYIDESSQCLRHVIFVTHLCHCSPCAGFQLIQTSLLFGKCHSFSYVRAFGKTEDLPTYYPAPPFLFQGQRSPHPPASSCPFCLPDYFSFRSPSGCSLFPTTPVPVPRERESFFCICLSSSLSPVDIVSISISVAMWAPGGRGILYTQCLAQCLAYGRFSINE